MSPGAPLGMGDPLNEKAVGPSRPLLASRHCLHFRRLHCDFSKPNKTLLRVYECSKGLRLAFLVLNSISYMDTVMGSWLFLICICVIKTDAVSATDAELLVLSCGSVFPWHSLLAPSSPPLSAPHQYGCYLFTQYLLLLHSSTGWIMAIFLRVRPYCKAPLLEISICYWGRVAAANLPE